MLTTKNNLNKNRTYSLTLSVPEKFKLGRVSSFSWLVTREGETQTCVSSIHLLLRDSFFLFHNRNSPFTWGKTPSVFLKRQTANVADTGQVNLSLEEV